VQRRENDDGIERGIFEVAPAVSDGLGVDPGSSCRIMRLVKS